MIDFTKIPNIHYWTQRVLPCVFDESLSYAEKINKLEEEINKLIEDYNTFGQAVTNEINTFEGETTNQINAFVTQITNDINSFKQNITNNINSFETDIRNIVEEFETSVTNSINAMQEVINNIPEIIEEKVNTLTMPYLQENVPSLVQQVISEKALTSLNEDDTKDLNTLTVGIMYSFINNDTILNKPTKLESSSFCIVYTFKPKTSKATISQRLVVCSGYTLGKSYYRRSETGIFPTTDTWVEETEKYSSVTPASVTDFDSLHGNTIYCTYLNTETFTHFPDDIPNNSYIKVMTSFKDPTKTLRIQFVYILYTPNTSNIVGSFRYRYEMQVGLWSTWFNTQYYQMPLIRNEGISSIDTFTQTGIYYAGGESGANWGGTIPPDLEQGKYYMQTVANSGNEIVQTIVNGSNTGNSLYTRMKNGSNWGEWQGISRRELLWSGVATVTNSTEYAQNGYTHIETSGITDVEISNPSNDLSKFVASHEVIVSVANANLTYSAPPLTTGYTFEVTRDEKTGKNVIKIKVVLENKVTGATSGSRYYVSYKLYKVN